MNFQISKEMRNFKEIKIRLIFLRYGVYFLKCVSAAKMFSGRQTLIAPTAYIVVSKGERWLSYQRENVGRRIKGRTLVVVSIGCAKSPCRSDILANQRRLSQTVVTNRRPAKCHVTVTWLLRATSALWWLFKRISAVKSMLIYCKDRFKARKKKFFSDLAETFL